MKILSGPFVRAGRILHLFPIQHIYAPKFQSRISQYINQTINVYYFKLYSLHIIHRQKKMLTNFVQNIKGKGNIIDTEIFAWQSQKDCQKFKVCEILHYYFLLSNFNIDFHNTDHLMMSRLTNFGNTPRWQLHEPTHTSYAGNQTLTDLVFLSHPHRLNKQYSVDVPLSNPDNNSIQLTVSHRSTTTKPNKSPQEPPPAS